MMRINEKRTIIAGDFNSHHTMWGYTSTNQDGDKLVEWMEAQNLYLIHDSKQRGSFHSARWKKDTNPDLCFVTTDQGGGPAIQMQRRILTNFPKSQHRPALIETGFKIPQVESLAKPRWNFNKARWKDFTRTLDDSVRWIPPTIENYERFTKLVISTAGKNIPRGYRKIYVPGWNKTCEELYQEYKEKEDNETAKRLMESLDSSRRERWMQMVEKMNFQKTSRKAWNLLRKLSGDKTIIKEPEVGPNQIANQIIRTSNAPNRDKNFSKEVRTKRNMLKKKAEERSKYAAPIEEEEITAAIRSLKTGKAAGKDKIYPEFVKHFGKNAKRWILRLFNNILETGKLPNLFKTSRIIAIPKPGKDHSKAENYRPITLLSVLYKTLERIIYNRIKFIIDDNIPVEQAGFRTSRSCVDQINALTTYIEHGFQENKKTAVAFIDLSAAYDTVWRTGLLTKFLEVIPCRTLYRLLNEMISNRRFTVSLGGKESRLRTLNNGLPQGSVLAPILFNLYTSDLPPTASRKFMYADDLALATQNNKMQIIEEQLEEDLDTLKEYFEQQRLLLNKNKTVVSAFHLTSQLAKSKLNIRTGNQKLQHEDTPKYLGVTLDRQLTYRKHIENTAAKVRTRNNIIHKLAGTTWGAPTATLRTSALALVYSAAEYAAPVWLNSAHTRKIDVELNATMRIITGTVRSTPTAWLPVLSNIMPPELRRKEAAAKEWSKYERNEALPIHNDTGVGERLKSRKPAYKTARELITQKFDGNQAWRQTWSEDNPDIKGIIQEPNIKPKGFDLPRRTWATLNRFRTQQGRCKKMLKRWGFTNEAWCDCGEEEQSMEHILEKCQKRALEGGWNEIAELSDRAVEWLGKLDINV